MLKVRNHPLHTMPWEQLSLKSGIPLPYFHREVLATLPINYSASALVSSWEYVQYHCNICKGLQAVRIHQLWKVLWKIVPCTSEMHLASIKVARSSKEVSEGGSRVKNEIVKKFLLSYSIRCTRKTANCKDSIFLLLCPRERRFVNTVYEINLYAKLDRYQL